MGPDTRFRSPESLVRRSSRASTGPPGVARPGLRRLAVVALVAMVGLSAYGSLAPASVRCGLPGAVGCAGGVLGPAFQPASAGVQWFDVVMYDWGFWIVDSSSGVNETNAWNVFEGWTVHINATSQAPTIAIGGTAYHGLGVEINATGQQLLSLAAPVGQWVSASFVAPMAEYHHQHIWCTIQCGPGHGGQQAWVLNVLPPTILPVVTATANSSSGHAPFSVAFTANTTLGTPPYNYSWNFGDGSPVGYGPAAAHIYTQGGAYYAVVTVTDAKGYQGTASRTITVLSGAPLTAALTTSASTGVAPLPEQLGVQAHGGVPPYNFSWNYGDGVLANAVNSTQHIYWDPGLYAILATVTDAVGARTTVVGSVEIRPATGALTVTLNASSPNGTAPFLVVLNASASGATAPLVDVWDLGDGSFAQGASVTHTYNSTGSYEARLFVIDAAGRVGSAARTFSVTSPASSGGGSDDGGGTDTLPAVAAPAAAAVAPSLYLTLTPSTGLAPLAVTATVSVVGGTGLNETASWTFGDGSTGAGQSVTHTYLTEGVYPVTVTTRDSAGTTASATSVVVVGGPVVRLVENTTSGDAPFSILAAASVTGGTGTYGAVSWNWGDGSASNGNVSTHSYTASIQGNVTIRASVTDSAGVNGSVAGTVVVHPPPTAQLAVNLPSSGGLPETVGLALTVSGGTGVYAATALWLFGDGTSGRAAASTSHAFQRFGDFLVTVSTSDSYGRAVNATAWVNLSLNLSLPKGKAPTWSLTGVPDPGNAALVLFGMVGATGLLFLYRRRRPPPRPVRPSATASAVAPSAHPAPPRGRAP